jgi:hypothetical protein
MWSLTDLQYDDAVPGDEVYLVGDDGELAMVPKADAIARAHAAGQHLVAEWPSGPAAGPVICTLQPMRLPPMWEQPTQIGATPAAAPAHDPELWFIASCGGRDFLLGNGHAFRGRMSAWCPQASRPYNVSLAEIREMSPAARYWVQGFLHGAEPHPPQDTNADAAAADLLAWQGACGRFRRTGNWFGRWRACQACGRVLWPDAAADQCDSHQGQRDDARTSTLRPNVCLPGR